MKKTGEISYGKTILGNVETQTAIYGKKLENTGYFNENQRFAEDELLLEFLKK